MCVSVQDVSSGSFVYFRSRSRGSRSHGRRQVVQRFAGRSSSRVEAMGGEGDRRASALPAASVMLNAFETSSEDVDLRTTGIETTRVGVLLLNLGGPESLDDVQPFLYNLFADPDIIRLPPPVRFLQKPLATVISSLRAPKVCKLMPPLPPRKLAKSTRDRVQLRNTAL